MREARETVILVARESGGGVQAVVGKVLEGYSG